VPGNERFRPLPEPPAPNFGRLPDGAKETFERRLDRLPIGRIRSRIGAEAIMSNESRVLHLYEREHRLTWDEFAPLGTWHMRAVHDRISSARPDLLEPRRPSGAYTLSRPAGRMDKTRRLLVKWRVWNFLSGTQTWVRNRAIEVRAATLRATGAR
jgi:hypothetical protein